MDFTPEQYLEAAKIVATCKENRLSIVLDILKKGGFDLSNDTVAEAIYDKMLDGYTTEEIKKYSRLKRYDKRWVKTSDPIVITLRNAYLDGVKISTIAATAGITRTVLYEYMIGRRQYSGFIAEKFILAFEKLGIPYPPKAPDPIQSENSSPKE